MHQRRYQSVEWIHQAMDMFLFLWTFKFYRMQWIAALGQTWHALIGKGRLRYNSNPFTTWQQQVMGGQQHSLPPQKNWCLLYKRIGWALDPVWMARKISYPPEFDPQSVQPIANCHTDYAIPAGNDKLVEQLSHLSRI